VPFAPFEHADVSAVTDQLWVGGDLATYDADLASAQLAELVGRGLTHVLDCREEWSDELFVDAEQPQLTYRWCGIADLGQPVGADWFDEVTGFALEALADPGHVVLAHCHAGINRGPSAGYAVLLAQGWDPVEALEEIRSVRTFAVMAYAEDALTWVHDRRPMVHSLEEDRARLLAWRARQRAELLDVIRLQREAREGDDLI
jgi:hypothetical protein